MPRPEAELERRREKRRAYRKRRAERKAAARAKAERKARNIAENNRPRMSVDDAAALVPDDLPDGAWMAMMGEFMGTDAGGVASAMSARVPRVKAKRAPDGGSDET